MRKSKRQFPPQALRFLKYTGVGATTFTFDLILLYLLTEFAKIDYIISATIAFIIANTLNYTLNRNFGFKKTKQTFFRGYIYLMTINTFSLVLILILLVLAVEMLGINYLIARIIIGIIVGIFNFAMNSKFTFKTAIFKK